MIAQDMVVATQPLTNALAMKDGQEKVRRFFNAALAIFKTQIN